jgi:hypothetical protein
MADRKITELTELTAPAADDLLPIIDSSEATSADKNKKIQFQNLARRLPDGSEGAASVGFLSDLGTSGFYRSGANEIAVANNSAFTGKFTTAGFQLGAGTAAAQFHLFSTDTTDQVIIENTDTGLDTAPDLVLYRNSASPAANDNLGNIEFRGEDDGGNAQVYAQILAGIQDPTDTAEVGILDLMSADSGSVASRIRLYGQYVGIGESAPAYPVHLTYSAAAGNALFIESKIVDAASAADITLYHHRNGAAGVAADIISSLNYRGNNDAGSPSSLDYGAISGVIVDPTSGAEEGKLDFQVADAGVLTSRLTLEGAALTFADAVDLAFDTTTGTKIGTATTQKIGFFDATPVVQPAAIADLTTTATTGTLPTADGTVTIADAAAPTVDELLEYCVELEAKLEAALAHLRTLGLIAT